MQVYFIVYLGVAFADSLRVGTICEYKVTAMLFIFSGPLWLKIAPSPTQKDQY